MLLISFSRRTKSHWWLAVGLLMALLPSPSAASSKPVGELVSGKPVKINGVLLAGSASLASGSRVAVGETTAVVTLGKNGVLAAQPGTEFSLVFDSQSVGISLEKGSLTYRKTSFGQCSITTSQPALVVVVKGVAQVMNERKGMEVVQEGEQRETKATEIRSQTADFACQVQTQGPLLGAFPPGTPPNKKGPRIEKPKGGFNHSLLWSLIGGAAGTGVTFGAMNGRSTHSASPTLP